MATNIRTGTVERSLIDAAIGAIDQTAFIKFLDEHHWADWTQQQARHSAMQALLRVSTDLDLGVTGLLMAIERNLGAKSDQELITLLMEAKRR